MVTRKIVEIDDSCNGCGQCIPNCHEGALEIVDGKARLVSDVFCDGLGNCLGHCPQDAIHVVEKDVDAFDFDATNTHLRASGKAELKENPLAPKLPCGCPGTAMRDVTPAGSASANSEQASALRQWPVQLTLLPPSASFFDNAHLLVASDCVPFACANFHSKLLNGKALVVGCPKLDDLESYQEKLTELFKVNRIKSVTVAMMEVPCCLGMHYAVEQAIGDSGKDIPLIKEVVSVSGELI